MNWRAKRLLERHFVLRSSLLFLSMQLRHDVDGVMMQMKDDRNHPMNVPIAQGPRC